MDTLFPQEDKDKCRVCNEQVVDGRWNYCSERCRDIAESVQEKFIWEEVRDKILERDNHTCQACGLSREMWYKAYRHSIHLAKDRNPHDRVSERDKWYEKDQELMEKYEIDSPSDGGFHVDHIDRIADGGHPFDKSNLQTLCKYCHREKTADENRTNDNPSNQTGLDSFKT